MKSNKTYSLIVLNCQPWVCAIRGPHFLGSTARIQSDILADCFCWCKLPYCNAKCVLLLGFNVQPHIFAVMIAQSQRRMYFVSTFYVGASIV